MQAVLYVSHGTRLEKGKQEAITCIKSIQKSVSAPLQVICFLEICTPTIAQGVSQLVKQGATSIAVVPVLLLSAKHDQEDIPAEIYKVQQQYPFITFKYGRPLGVQDRLVDILVERTKASSEGLGLDVPILLVGRGSFVKSVQTDMTAIADKLHRQTNRIVDVAYLAACKPSFDDLLKQMAEQNQKEAIVVPYLWFNGLLIQSMKMKINQYNERCHANLILTHQLANHPSITKALIERTKEII